jgi:23S rRNA maturation mini-RNase III
MDMLNDWSDRDEKDDPDYRRDTAIYDMNIRAHVSTFFKTVAQQNAEQLHQLAATQLTAEEQAILQAALRG